MADAGGRADYRTFTADDLQPELVAAGIDATVLVQTVDTLDDTDAMLATADRHAFVAAVVGWVPLTDARSTRRPGRAPDPRLRGIVTSSTTSAFGTGCCATMSRLGFGSSPIAA